jgi:protein-tyrosine phosphatase
MIDIHSHPLTGVDDGAKDFDTSVEMCRIAAADGVTHLVATPHYSYSYPFNPEVNRAKLAELKAAVGNLPQLLLGCDFHLSFDNVRELVKNPRAYTINATAYLLVEFPDHFIPEQIERVLFDVQMDSLIPILTHPERNPVFRRRPQLLYHWVARGCLAQVTAKSFLGGFGSEAERLSVEWLQMNLVHFLASDAHDTHYRPPILSQCYQKVVQISGPETAERLLRTNPRAVIEGHDLAPQPEPVGYTKPKRKWRWLSFLQRR